VNTIPPSLVRFEDQLEEAIRRRARRPRRLVVRTVLVAAGAVAVALGVLSVLPGSGPSVVERAAAALTVSDGSILHVVQVGTATNPDGVTATMRVETWEQSTSPYDRRDITVGGNRRLESGSENDQAELYDPAANTLYVPQVPATGATSGKPVAGKPQAPAERASGDRYKEKILSLLASGELHEDGHVTVQGRDAIRLVSEDGSVQLSVDAGTYEPIEWRDTAGGWTAVAQFPTYEHLPSTDANRALTSLRAQHPSAAIDTNPADYEAAAQRLAPAKVGSARQGDAAKTEPKKS
jgi:hypothetical protein